MRSLLRVAALLLAASMLASCMGPVVRAQVSRFNALAAKPGASTFHIVPQEGQKGSVEFQAYSASVARRLVQKGYLQAGSFGEADLLVTLAYGMKGSREVVESRPVHEMRGGDLVEHTGTVYTASGPRSFTTTTRTPITYERVGSETYSYTMYERFFRLRLYDREATAREKTNVAVYEAAAVSSGRSATFQPVAECMFDTVFRNFQGNGPEYIEIPTEECGK